MRTSSAFAASDELRQRAKISRRVMPKVLALLIEVVEPRQIRPGAGIIPIGHSSEASQLRGMQNAAELGNTEAVWPDLAAFGHSWPDLAPGLGARRARDVRKANSERPTANIQH